VRSGLRRLDFFNGDRMALRDLKARTILLSVLGWGITLLFVTGITAIWRRNFHPALWYLISGAVLTFVFFHKRMFAFAIIGLTFILANVGLTAVFHPTIAGILLTIGSSGCLYVIIRWHTRKYPNLNPKDWQTTIFENNSKS
jgi:hypothetical protein